MDQPIFFAIPPVAIQIQDLPLVVYAVWEAPKGNRRFQLQITKRGVRAKWEGRQRPFFNGTWEEFVHVLGAFTERTRP